MSPQRSAQALKDNNGFSFAVHGQPIKPVFAKHDDEPQWYELLLRMHDPILGIQYPIDFMPPESEVDALQKIDYWVLNRAARILSDHPELHLSINFTKHLLKSDQFLEETRAILHGVNGRLHMEIAERYIWSACDIDQLKQLHAIVRLHLDDLGQARLQELVNLPIDGFKIDGSLITQVRRNPKAANLVLTLIEFAAGLDLVCVCEWVADQDTWDWLKDAALSTPCKLFVQGHGVGPVLYRKVWD